MKFPHRLVPGERIRLSDVPTNGKKVHDDRDEGEEEFKQLRREFEELQNRLYAEGKHKLLIVFQAMDAGGKDGTIRAVFQRVDPQGIQCTSFKAPTHDDLAHDFLWRVHKAVPGTGMIGVFNRSHYEDVLVVRVNRLVPESVWRPRYALINEFEWLLATSGTTILKFFLHVSKQEQKRRFEERLSDPEKHWKFDEDDLNKRKQWDDYQEAYEEMLNECTTEHAPWHVIPADQNWYRNLSVARIIVGTLRELNPQFPKRLESMTKEKID